MARRHFSISEAEDWIRAWHVRALMSGSPSIRAYVQAGHGPVPPSKWGSPPDFDTPAGQSRWAMYVSQWISHLPEPERNF